MSETKVKIILPENNESKIEETEKKLRVAAYCRVSTNSEEQATSYEAQVSYYTNYILQNPKWEMAGIFADDGISATNTQKRDDFNALIDACVSGKVDMVLTKSISRFARNTVDSLYHIRLLKEKNIPRTDQYHGSCWRIVNHNTKQLGSGRKQKYQRKRKMELKEEV